MKRERIDKLLVERGLAPTRTRAQALVMAGAVLVDEQRVAKSSETFAPDASVRVRGADDPSFPSIVASAERGAFPHAVRTDEPIPARTLVTFDLGARLDGYCSDCTRTWATGELPDDLAEAYALVRRAQSAGPSPAAAVR